MLDSSDRMPILGSWRRGCALAVAAVSLVAPASAEDPADPERDTASAETAEPTDPDRDTASAETAEPADPDRDTSLLRQSGLQSTA